MTTMGVEAFNDCYQLETVTLGDGVGLGDYAFNHCTNLSQVNFLGTIGQFDMYAFAHCPNLKSVEFKPGTTVIGNAAFEECTGLESVIIPDGVLTIEPHCFEGCESLTSIAIPESVTSIGDCFIIYCTAMADLYVYHTTPLVIGNKTFDMELKQHITLHVPSGSKDAYSSSPYWKDFHKIVDDITPTGISTVMTDPGDAIIFDTNGHHIGCLQLGINIVKKKDGQVVKVFKK